MNLLFAEPCEGGPIESIKMEINGDIPKKIAIVLNRALGIQGYKSSEFSFAEFGEEESRKIREIMNSFEDYRYIVSFTKDSVEPETWTSGKSLRLSDGWNLNYGLKKISSKKVYERLKISGVNNAALVINRDGSEYFISGPGAGPIPTVGAMMRDAERIEKST